MKLVRKTAGYTRMDKKRNTCTYRVLNAIPRLTLPENYKDYAIDIVNRLNKYRIPRHMKKCSFNEKR